MPESNRRWISGGPAWAAEARLGDRLDLPIDNPATAVFDEDMSRFSAVSASVLLLSLAARKARTDDWAPPDTVITMTRGGCEQRCPVYSVVIFSDGTVIVQGQYYLRKPVLAKSDIPGADVRRLVERFKALDYFHLSNTFGFKGKGCTSLGDYDAPVVITTIVTAGEGKSISHHGGCLGAIPDRLAALEHEIDETAHTGRWLNRALRK